jgi:hypothetical protein
MEGSNYNLFRDDFFRLNERVQASQSTIICQRDEYCVGGGDSDYFSGAEDEPIFFDQVSTQMFQHVSHSCKKEIKKCDHWNTTGCSWESLGCQYVSKYKFNSGFKGLPSFGESFAMATDRYQKPGKISLREALTSETITALSSGRDILGMISDLFATGELYSNSYVYEDIARWSYREEKTSDGKKCDKLLGILQSFNTPNYVVLDELHQKIDHDLMAKQSINTFTCKDNQYEWIEYPSNLWNSEFLKINNRYISKTIQLIALFFFHFIF